LAHKASQVVYEPVMLEKEREGVKREKDPASHLVFDPS